MLVLVEIVRLIPLLIIIDADAGSERHGTGWLLNVKGWLGDLNWVRIVKVVS